jgi:RND family efflux transporter MFP subunit
MNTKTLRTIWTVWIGLTWSLVAADGGIYATFTVQAQRQADLALGMSGIVKTLNVDVGDRVRKGTVLATLENDDLKAAYDAVVLAEEYARKDYERIQQVREVSDQARIDGATFKYRNAQVQKARAKALYDKTILKAPFDGTIAARNLEVGDAFSAMRPVSFYRLQSTHTRKLILSFDQKYWKQVRPGMTFVYTIEGDTASHRGKIVRVYPAANTRNRKMQAEVPARDIPVGLYGEGHIVLDVPAQSAEQ